MSADDIASDYEERHREASIAAALAAPTETPNVGCSACLCAPGDPQGKDCEHYAGCLEDWEKRRWAESQRP